MSTLYPDAPWPDPNFDKNNRDFPVEELWKYAGQHIAWSMDGTQLLAGAPTGEGLFRKLQEAGIDPQRVVFDYVDAPSRATCSATGVGDPVAQPVLTYAPHPDVPSYDPNFEKNNSQFPFEELWKYAGQHVAWSMDGTQLLAGDPSLDGLFRKLNEAGIDPQRVVLDYVQPPDMGFI